MSAESAETKTLRSAVRILGAPESDAIAHVTRTGPLDLRRDALADDAQAEIVDEIRNLKLAKVALIQVIARKKALLASIINRRTHISALPPEILSLILIEGYQLFLQDCRTTKFPDLQAVNPTMYLGTISSVCRRWREAAVSTPGLWTQLDLAWSSAQCNMWIARSGATRSLDLSGYYSLEKDPGVTRDTASFEVIAPALHRWRSISLQHCSQATVRRVFQRINEVPYSCDQLQEIEIKSYDSYMARTPDHGSLDSVLWSSHASNNAIDRTTMFPRLRHLILLPGEYSLWGMLAKVVHLELHQPRGMSWQHWHSMLTEATALETLHITSQSGIVEDQLPLRMDRLQTLDIGGASHDTFTQCWFQNVTAPSLRDLLFEHSRKPEDVGSVNAGRLCDFISRSPLLTALTLRAENSFAGQVLILMSNATVIPLAEKLEKLSIFPKMPYGAFPREAVQRFVTRHLRHPDNYRALDTMIVSDGHDRVWLELYVTNFHVQNTPPLPVYSSTYHLPDYSGHQQFVLGDEDDEEDDEDEFGDPYGDDEIYDDAVDSADGEPDELFWMQHYL